nr:putative Methyltransferase [uncultured bacterium]
MKASFKNSGFLVVTLVVAVLLLSGCQAVHKAASPDDFAGAINARTAEDRARDIYRHPAETLAFFGIEPGMTVVEVLPGGGWYSKIIAPYLGPDGTLHAVNYADEMWDMFGFFSADRIAERQQQMDNWATAVADYGGNPEGATGGSFGRIDPSLQGSVDAVLFIRALHNLNRFEERAGTRSAALAEVYQLLKPGGIVGVVQHQAPESADDRWAVGQNGYLKRSAVIDMFERAGFELVATSALNENFKDQPSAGDFVWRLPPSLRNSEDNPAQRADMLAIGESNRMTLKFIKPE